MSVENKEPRMSRMLRGSMLFMCLILILALPVMAQVTQPNDANGRTPQAQMPGHATQSQPTMTFHALQHGVPWRDPNATVGPVGFAAPAGAHLSYNGGPII